MFSLRPIFLSRLRFLLYATDSLLRHLDTRNFCSLHHCEHHLFTLNLTLLTYTFCVTQKKKNISSWRTLISLSSYGVLFSLKQLSDTLHKLIIHFNFQMTCITFSFLTNTSLSSKLSLNLISSHIRQSVIPSVEVVQPKHLPAPYLTLIVASFRAKDANINHSF